MDRTKDNSCQLNVGVTNVIFFRFATHKEIGKRKPPTIVTDEATDNLFPSIRHQIETGVILEISQVAGWLKWREWT